MNGADRDHASALEAPDPAPSGGARGRATSITTDHVVRRRIGIGA